MQKINIFLAKKIQAYLKKGNKPLIILISGVNGVGKTSIAFTLSNILAIKQRVGLGTIVKTLIAISSEKNKENYLHMDNKFSCTNEKDLKKYALLISKPVNLLIEKYTQGHISCIIEGVQLLPIYLQKNIIHFHIEVNNPKKYKAQLGNPNIVHKHRVKDQDFKNLLKVDKFLKKEMFNHKVHILKNSRSQITIINEILESIIININKK